MEKLLQELLDILKAKHTHFQDFLDLIKKEREVIIRNKTEELQKMIGTQERILENTSQLEESRIKVVEKMAAKLKVKPADLTMSRIIEETKEPLKSRCKDIYEQISKTLEEIERVNKINAELVKGSLDYIDFSLKALTKARSANPTYEGSGKMRDITKDQKSFDQEI